MRAASSWPNGEASVPPASRSRNTAAQLALTARGPCRMNSAAVPAISPVIPGHDGLPPEAELPGPVWLAPVWLAPVWLAVAGSAPVTAASWSTGAGWSGTAPLADFSSQLTVLPSL